MRVRLAVAALFALALTTVTGVRPVAADCGLAHADAPCLDPWLDRGAAVPLADPPPPADHRLGAALGVGALYAGFSTWAYLAWYRDVQSLDEFGWGGDGWFGRNTYAGGADKLGHAWATMVLARATTGVLRAGGYTRVPAAIAGTALSWGLFLAVEVKDGFYYKFSPGDLTMNTAGAVFALLANTVPAVDRWLDFRVEYWFSDEYLGLWRGEYYGSKKGNSLNIAEDYSGETYFVALHAGAVPLPKATPAWLADGLAYLDVGIGFETRRYKPDAPPEAVPTQRVFVGVTLDLQHVLARTLGGRTSRLARTTRSVGTNLFEVLAPPFSILPVVGSTRAASGPAPEQ